MFRLYYSNQPIAAFGYPIVALLLTFLAWTNGYKFEIASGILSLWGAALPDILRGVLAFLALWLNASYLNRIFQKHEFHHKLTYLSGILFLFLFFGLSFKNINLSLLVSMPFLFLGMDKVLGVFRENVAKAPYFDAGFWIGVSALIYSPIAIFIFPLFGCINFTRTFNWREWFLALVGLVLPLIYFVIYTFLWAPANFEWTAILPVEEHILNPGNMAIALLVFTVIGVIAGLRYYAGSYSGSNNRSRNAKSEFLFFALGAVLVVGLQYFFSEPDWELMAFPFGFFLTYLIADVPKPVLKPILFYALILLPLLTYFMNLKLI